MSIIVWTITLLAIYLICFSLGKVLEPYLKGFTLILMVLLAIILLSLAAGIIDNIIGFPPDMVFE